MPPDPPGFRICHAARYQSRLTLAERLQAFHDAAWRTVSASELTALTNSERSARDVSVIAIPKHLLKRWWSLVESDKDGLDAGFRLYSREIAEYLNYKGWALPPGALMEAVAIDQARETPWMKSSAATRFANGLGTLLAVINLGDEELGMVLGDESVRIRIILEPGEGVMLPRVDILWDLSIVSRSNLTTVLLIGLLSPQ